jgi:multidrug efflux pump
MFWPGIVGDFMGYLPLTLIITLSSSLFVALVLVPVLCALFMKLDGAPAADAAGGPAHAARRLRPLLLLIAANNVIAAIMLAATAVALVALHRLAGAAGALVPGRSRCPARRSSATSGGCAGRSTTARS